jgi:hypothetical protein
LQQEAHLPQARRVPQLSACCQEGEAHCDVVGGAAQEGRVSLRCIGPADPHPLQQRQLGLQVNNGCGLC